MALSDMASAIDKMKTAPHGERQQALDAALRASKYWHKEARCQVCMLNYQVQADTARATCTRCASEILPTWEMQTARWTTDETAAAMEDLTAAVWVQ